MQAFSVEYIWDFNARSMINEQFCRSFPALRISYSCLGLALIIRLTRESYYVTFIHTVHFVAYGKFYWNICRNDKIMLLLITATWQFCQ